MKKTLRTICALLLVVVLSGNCVISAWAVEEASDPITEMISQNVSESQTEVTASTVETVCDFDNNVYYAAEFTDTGYLICHGARGETIEYSLSAPSPYAEYETGLYYCGPLNLFVLQDGIFTHT